MDLSPDLKTSSSPLDNRSEINPLKSIPSAENENTRFKQFYAAAAVD